MAFLVKNPPRRRQFRERAAKPTGCIVVHTAESVMDTVGPDTGAENVANFIRNRTDPGSYHILADSDSRIRLVPFAMAAYGDGTGSNEFAIHISAACRTTDWKVMSAARRAGFIRQMALGAAVAAKWLKRTHGIDVPTKRITRAESSAGKPGFISHGERDPGRRTDPGADFPWSEFFTAFDAAMGRDNLDAELISELVATRKALTASIRKTRQARRALLRSAAVARKAKRARIARALESRANRLAKQNARTVTQRNWVNGRIKFVRGN